MLYDVSHAITAVFSNSTAGVYSAMAEADPKAVWIMQGLPHCAVAPLSFTLAGWFLVNGGYWNASTVLATCFVYTCAHA